MARIDALLAAGATTSFEFFPPRTDAGEQRLWQAVAELEPLAPSYVSVTYGAGGSTRERTQRLVVELLDRTTITPMAHLTAVGHRREELARLIESYHHAGIENLLALRGDPPASDPDAAWWELPRAVELVELAKARTDGQLAVGVAAHPEGHPLSSSLQADRRSLAEKLRAADFAITQLFFRAEDYLRMVDDLQRLGCDKPVVAGVMPVTDVAQIERFAALSGAAFPPELAGRLHAVAHDPAEVRRIGVEVATEMCLRLLAEGCPGLHFYTLNRSTATREIHRRLQSRPERVDG